MRSALFGAMLAILAVHTLPAVAQAQPKDKAGAKAEPPPISKDEAAAVGFTVLGLGGIALIVAAMVAFCSYFAPTMIALFRGHPNIAPIGVVNFFLGWSLIGWVVALAWSVSAFEPKRRAPRSSSASEDNPFA